MGIIRRESSDVSVDTAHLKEKQLSMEVIDVSGNSPDEVHIYRMLIMYQINHTHKIITYKGTPTSISPHYIASTITSFTSSSSST